MLSRVTTSVQSDFNITNTTISTKWTNPFSPWTPLTHPPKKFQIGANYISGLGVPGGGEWAILATPLNSWCDCSIVIGWNHIDALTLSTVTQENYENNSHLAQFMRIKIWAPNLLRTSAHPCRGPRLPGVASCYRPCLRPIVWWYAVT